MMRAHALNDLQFLCREAHGFKDVYSFILAPLRVRAPESA